MRPAGFKLMETQQMEDEKKSSLEKKKEFLAAILNARYSLPLQDFVLSADGTSKSATWREIGFNDCVMTAGSTLTIYPDGTARFDAVTYTKFTHTKDRWHIALDGNDRNGTQLFLLGPTSGPEMDDGNGGPPPQYTWHGYTFTYDANYYNIVVSAGRWDSC